MTVTEIVQEMIEEAEILEFQGYYLAAETIRKFVRIATPIQIKALEDFV
jgi:predicted DNA-binding protein